MAYSLVGTVVSSCDTAADFTNNNGGANITTDDDFVEGTGAVGDKMSGSNELLVSDNLSGGAAGVYDFSSGGADEGAHFIGWINTKTSIQATTGLQVMFRNASGHEGSWYVIPAFFYKGGFITRVINPEADFDTATTWTTTGNPAQLDDVSEMGFEFDMLATIMGNFNNAQVDQFTVGYGIRADVGTSGTPNTFEGVRVQDEDTSFWGWWSSANGAFVGKGKLYIGPAAGTTASWFVDSAFSVNFADENVAVGFYEFSIRGANTTCEWTLANIQAANPTNARWSLTLDSAMGSTTGGFLDTAGTWIGSDVITLNQYAEMDGTTLIDGTRLVQNDAIIDGITVIEANVATNVAYLLTSDPALIDNSEFNANSGAVGHAIEIDTAGTYSFDNNLFTGYTGTAGSAAIWFNPTGGTGNLVLNVVNGGNISASLIRNSSAGTVTVNNTVTLTVTVLDENGDPVEGARVRIENAVGGAQISQGSTNASGIYTDSTYSYGGDVDILAKVRLKGFKNFRTTGTITSTGLSVGVRFRADDIVDLP